MELKFIKPLTSKEVFESWRKIEENVEHWKPFWTARGHKSWEEWRKKTHAPLFSQELKWALYEISKPLLTIPEWRGGMFRSWSKWFYSVFPEQPPRLKDLLTHPGVHNHWYIREIANNFRDTETTLTATRLPAQAGLPNGDICIAEGMHRACAIAMMAHDNKSLSSKVFVMLADWVDHNPPHLGSWDK